MEFVSHNAIGDWRMQDGGEAVYMLCDITRGLHSGGPVIRGSDVTSEQAVGVERGFSKAS